MDHGVRCGGDSATTSVSKGVELHCVDWFFIARQAPPGRHILRQGSFPFLPLRRQRSGQGRIPGLLQFASFSI